jgi:hypothetical protein
MLALVNLQKLLAAIRSSKVFIDQHRLFAHRPTLVATCALLYGRQYGHWECGAIEQIDLPDPDKLTAEVRGRPDLEVQLRKRNEIAQESRLRVAEAVQESIGLGIGVEALSQWEGFGRFCRRCLGVEALTLLRAYELGIENPAAEVLAPYPDAKFYGARAAEREGHWAGGVGAAVRAPLAQR